jgi:hypothetical protein
MLLAGEVGVWKNSSSPSISPISRIKPVATTMMKIMRHA